jgi:hypothetical protein
VAGAMKLQAGTPANVQGAPSQHRIDLTLENDSNEDCTVGGIAFVTIVGPGEDYAMHQQQNIKPEDVRLKKAEKAAFMITYLEASADSAQCTGGMFWRPTTINVKISESSQPLSTKWTGETMNNCQSGATHPGDFVSPFTRA